MVHCIMLVSGGYSRNPAASAARAKKREQVEGDPQQERFEGGFGVGG